jgi:hypothetical protein
LVSITLGPAGGFFADRVLLWTERDYGGVNFLRKQEGAGSHTLPVGSPSNEMRTAPQKQLPWDILTVNERL